MQVILYRQRFSNVNFKKQAAFYSFKRDTVWLRKLYEDWISKQTTTNEDLDNEDNELQIREFNKIVLDIPQNDTEDQDGVNKKVY